jgi:hypothetical protein
MLYEYRRLLSGALRHADALDHDVARAIQAA